MTVMPAPSSQHQWYLARDGQQYGPLSDPELAKFVELGHLQPADLLWREGFSDWRPALAVFPPKTAGPIPGSLSAHNGTSARAAGARACESRLNNPRSVNSCESFVAGDATSP